jgi:hypothetical protein
LKEKDKEKRRRRKQAQKAHKPTQIGPQAYSFFLPTSHRIIAPKGA